MKVKVEVRTLIQRAEQHKRDLVVEHRANLKKYEQKVERFERAALVALDRARADAKKGKFPTSDESHRNGAYLIVRTSAAKPSKPTLNTSRVDRDLGILRACADDVISVATDDNFARYL